jgi:hypothetical protein
MLARLPYISVFRIRIGIQLVHGSKSGPDLESGSGSRQVEIGRKKGENEEISCWRVWTSRKTLWRFLIKNFSNFFSKFVVINLVWIYQQAWFGSGYSKIPWFGSGFCEYNPKQCYMVTDRYRYRTGKEDAPLPTFREVETKAKTSCQRKR